MSSGSRQAGFTYLVALLAVSVAGLGLATIAETWSHARQREKETELLWIGNQFKQAIGLYYHRSSGAVKRYPSTLEDLLADTRSLTVQRYLRRIYTDPISGKAQWGIVSAPGGGIMGVYSLSEGQPIAQKLQPSQRYSDWKFVYEPNM